MHRHHHASTLARHRDCTCPGRFARGLVAAVVVALAPCRATAGAPGPETAPKNAGAAQGTKRARRTQAALEYLTGLYTRQLGSSDWIARAAAVISLSRLPADEATQTIVEHVANERHSVGQLVAWQAVLARADGLSEKQFATWETVTWQMVRRDLFHGDLRIGLLEMLSSRPITRDSRTYFRSLFRKTSSLDSSDVPTLIAMGRALRAWGDAELVEILIRAMGDPSTAVRAELILQAAGVDMPWCRTPSAQRVYAQWWRKNRPKFTGVSVPQRRRRSLKPQFIPSPMELAAFDPGDIRWRREMEIGRLRLGSFALAIAMDCSRSMRAEIDRLKRDMRIMFASFELIAREVGVGITLFAPGGLVKHLPLTGDLRRLMAYVNAADIFGPAGEEEWAGALATAMKAGRWPAPGQYSRRAIVLISDEPITQPQFDRAIKLARSADKEGFRIYGVMIRSAYNVPSNPLSIPFDRTAGGSVFGEDPEPPGSRAAQEHKGKRAGTARSGGWAHYGEIAEATGGRAIEVEVPQGGLGLGSAPKATGSGKGKGKGKGKKQKAGQKGPRARGENVDPMAIAPIYPGGGPTSRILTLVLTDAINPRYADRIEPLVKILVAYCQKAAARIPERRAWARPGPMEPNLK